MPRALLGPIPVLPLPRDMNVAELYEARMLIESDVARRAALHLTDPEIDALDRILAAQRDTLGYPDAFRASVFAFHMASGPARR